MISITPELSVGYEIRPADLEAVLAFVCAYAVAGLGPIATAVAITAFVVGAVAVSSPKRVREIAVRRVARRLTDPANAFLLGPRTLVLGKVLATIRKYAANAAVSEASS